VPDLDVRAHDGEQGAGLGAGGAALPDTSRTDDVPHDDLRADVYRTIVTRAGVER
jgi:hypothetical protein